MIGNLQRKLKERFSESGWLPLHMSGADSGAVAITFDDGPSPNTTPMILDILDAAGATAGFFLCGERAERYPELVREIATRGHAIYSHGHRHDRMDLLSPAAFEDDLAQAEAVLAELRPTPSPYLLRLPYGSGHGSAAVHARLRAWRDDVQLVHWRYNFRDWTLADGCEDLDALSVRCDDAVKTAVCDRRFAGAILLLHEDPIGAEAPLASAIAPVLLASLLRGLGMLGMKTTAIQPARGQASFRRHVRLVALR